MADEKSKTFQEMLGIDKNTPITSRLPPETENYLKELSPEEFTDQKDNLSADEIDYYTRAHAGFLNNLARGVKDTLQGLVETGVHGANRLAFGDQSPSSIASDLGEFALDTVKSTGKGMLETATNFSERAELEPIGIIGDALAFTGGVLGARSGYAAARATNAAARAAVPNASKLAAVGRLAAPVALGAADIMGVPGTGSFYGAVPGYRIGTELPTQAITSAAKKMLSTIDEKIPDNRYTAQFKNLFIDQQYGRPKDFPEVTAKDVPGQPGIGTRPTGRSFQSLVDENFVVTTDKPKPRGYDLVDSTRDKYLFDYIEKSDDIPDQFYIPAKSKVFIKNQYLITHANESRLGLAAKTSRRYFGTAKVALNMASWVNNIATAYQLGSARGGALGGIAAVKNIILRDKDSLAAARALGIYSSPEVISAKEASLLSLAAMADTAEKNDWVTAKILRAAAQNKAVGAVTTRAKMVERGGGAILERIDGAAKMVLMNQAIEDLVNKTNLEAGAPVLSRKEVLADLQKHNKLGEDSLYASEILGSVENLMPTYKHVPRAVSFFDTYSPLPFANYAYANTITKLKMMGMTPTLQRTRYNTVRQFEASESDAEAQQRREAGYGFAEGKSIPWGEGTINTRGWQPMPGDATWQSLIPHVNAIHGAEHTQTQRGGVGQSQWKVGGPIGGIQDIMANIDPATGKPIVEDINSMINPQLKAGLKLFSPGIVNQLAKIGTNIIYPEDRPRWEKEMGKTTTSDILEALGIKISPELDKNRYPRDIARKMELKDNYDLYTKRLREAAGDRDKKDLAEAKYEERKKEIYEKYK